MVAGWFNIDGVRVSIRPGRKGRRRYRSNSTRAKQRCTLARVFGAAALQPFSVLRPFYERRALFGSFVKERESGGRGTGARSLLETVRVTFYGMMVYAGIVHIRRMFYPLDIFVPWTRGKLFARMEENHVWCVLWSKREIEYGRWLENFWRRVKLFDRWILSSCNFIEW